MTRKIIYTTLLCSVFLYGFSVGFFKIFPFRQVLAVKHYIEFSTGTYEAQQETDLPDSAIVLESFLQRLLLKKIQIPEFTGHGGGLSISGNLLYIITNKGSVQTFDLENYQKLENNITNVPMNFSELIRSGHPYKNNFKINWFRVNGFYSEKINDSTHLLFVSHNAYDSDRDCISHNISRIELNVSNQSISQNENWETIFTASPCIDPVPDKMEAAAPYPGHISGGAISQFDEQNLLISVGDYNRHGIKGTDEWAMKSTNPYGKFILMNKYSGEWSIYTLGHRNASGLYIDNNSVIWAVENGPAGGDELNIILEGKNYGWPKVSLGLWYDATLKLPGNQKSGTHPEFKSPAFSWIPSVAPSSIIKIEGAKFKYWDGDLLIGTMRDQSLHRLRLDGENNVIYDERINIGHRIRDLTTLPDDKIALLTDDSYLIIIEDGGSVFHEVDSYITERMTALDNFNRFTNKVDESVSTQVYESTSKTIYQQKCASCHNLNPDNQIGPHLYNLLNRKVGSVRDYNYSQTLKNETRSWNAQLLKSFLSDPNDLFPGNQMQEINLSTNEIDSLVHFFKNQDN